MIDQINLRQRIEAAWTMESSFTPDKWRSDNPAIGQCGVTALYVHAYLVKKELQHMGKVIRNEVGGTLMEGWLEPEKVTRHLFNCVNGVMIDFTWGQFPVGTKLCHVGKTTKYDILENPWFAQRYLNFLDNIKNQL